MMPHQYIGYNNSYKVATLFASVQHHIKFARPVAMLQHQLQVCKHQLQVCNTRCRFATPVAVGSKTFCHACMWAKIIFVMYLVRKGHFFVEKGHVSAWPRIVIWSNWKIRYVRNVKDFFLCVISTPILLLTKKQFWYFGHSFKGSLNELYVAKKVLKIGYILNNYQDCWLD